MYPSPILALPRGGYREGAGSKPKPPAEVASVRIVANVTPAEAQEWARRGRTAWLRAELRGSKLWADKQLPSGVKRQDVCVWMQDSDGTWCTSCGVTWEFIDGMPADNKAHFCHHCGGVLLGDGFEEASASGPKES